MTTLFFTSGRKFLAALICSCVLGIVPVAQAKDGPIAQFTQEHLDLGVIKQGQTPEGHFTVQNIGDETLIIKEIKPSCGCTAAMMDSMEIPPGKEGKMKISIDTTGKELDIDKTITVLSNDSFRSEILLTVSVVVEPSEHPDFDMGASLFSEKCASCHVDSGKGLKGKELYLAICYQCHGKKGEGATAPALNTVQYSQEHSHEFIFNWIAQGGKGTAMAGYGKDYGGFLSKEEIDSLVDFLRQLSLPKKEK